MRFLESDKQGNQHFTFEHSSPYQMVQKRFYGAVESMNPDLIVVSVKLCPLTACGKSILSLVHHKILATTERAPIPRRFHATIERHLQDGRGQPNGNGIGRENLIRDGGFLTQHVQPHFWHIKT